MTSSSFQLCLIMTEKPFLFIDADDTLWENERFFRDAEARFAELLAPHSPLEEVQSMLWEKQEENISLFGYGSKTYMIGMTDAAIEICGGTLPRDTYLAIKKIITDLAFHELELFPGVRETLETLSERYRLVLATKGDAVEQMAKVEASGLAPLFSAIEVMKNKEEDDYLTLCAKFGIRPSEMIMVGNSVRSDILPVIGIGGRAIYIPHEIVWVHEIAELPHSDKLTKTGEFCHLVGLLMA